MSARTEPSRIAIISTGGTIEKTYCELGGELSNQASVLDVMLSQFELEGVVITRVPLMNKDSIEMSQADHDLIARTVAEQAADHDGVVVVHGTDRLAETGECIHALLPDLSVPVVLTGAMRPYELRRTDALQNLVESLMAVQLLAPGVWCVMHNRALRFPGVRKDLERGTFVDATEL